MKYEVIINSSTLHLLHLILEIKCTCFCLVLDSRDHYLSIWWWHKIFEFPNGFIHHGSQCSQRPCQVACQRPHQYYTVCLCNCMQIICYISYYYGLMCIDLWSLRCTANTTQNTIFPMCPKIFAPSLIPGQRDPGTRKFICPRTKRH